MSKKANKPREKKLDPNQGTGTLKQDTLAQPGPWISMKTGIFVITVTSILMAALTAWQYIPAVGWLDGILYGLLYGGLVWAAFVVMQVFFRWLRR
ncbi:MAG TPA: hypothetical protein VMC62_07870 [Longilinea sp.]|nr:hypothetical protein [Longilinea sp.]